MSEQQQNMTEAERELFLSACLCTIAVCKEEVEKVFPQEVIDAADDGSPWGRAFLRIVAESKEV